MLAASVLESSHAASQISASSQQQLAGVDQVAEAMTSIRDACDDHLVGIKKVEDAVNRLNDIASMLQRLVNKYVSSGTSSGGGNREDATEMSLV